MDLAEKIIAYRAEHGISQAEFAKRCGLGRAAIMRIERGDRNARKTTEFKILSAIEKGGENGR